MSIDYVDVAAAQAAPGVRLVVAAMVPSPWSEAAKGVFRIAGVPVLAVRRTRDAADITAWTGIDNVPVVLHGAEPARSHWAAITTLAARLAGPGVVVPDDPGARITAMGLLHEIAGEDGVGWNARIAMIHASLTSEGQRGFSLAIGRYLAARYGYGPDAMAAARGRIERQLALLHDQLAAQHALGHGYLGGAAPSALDVYLATFLTPLSEISEADCPALQPRLREAFGTAHEAFGALVSPALRAHRTLMFQRHLAWPITL